MNKKGFTLVEILVAVLILTILITMAVPMYEKTVEKSRLAEVSAMLKRISESKLRTMDSMNITTYTRNFGLNMLDIKMPESKDFTYSLYPASYPNAVCARRLRGDHSGTTFLYLGEVAEEYCRCNTMNYPPFVKSVCGEYCNNGRKLFCQNASGKTSCEIYGLTSFNFGACV